MRNRRFRLFCLAACLVPAACATPSTKLVEVVAPIATGLEQAKQQSDLTFTKTNAMARDLDIARVVENNPPNLVEADFPQAIKLEDRQKWSNAFSALQAYTRNLQNLVDPARSETTKTNLQALGSELNDGVVQAGLPAAAIAAFAQFGKVLVQLRAERTAQDIMRQTDPAFRDVLLGMADTIGDNQTGLRFTTRSYWESALADLRTQYSELRSSPNSDPAKRKALAALFVKAMDDRDAQLASLGTLKDSLAALAEAHQAAARGDHGDALFWVQRISTWLDDAKAKTAAPTPASGAAK